MAITFEDYILGLTSGTITTGSDYIPYYDAGVSEVRKGSIIQPTAWSDLGILIGGTGGSGATLTVTNAKYSAFGYLEYFVIEATLTSKGTCTGDVSILGTGIGNVKTVLTGGIYASGANTSRGVPYADGGYIKFMSAAPSTNLNWTALTVGDYIMISGFYGI